MGAKVKGQGHKMTFDKMHSQQFCYMLSELFPVIFQRISSKLGLYIGSTSRINPVNFQVRTQKVKVTVRKKQKMGGGQC